MFDVAPDGQRFVFVRSADVKPPPMADRIQIVLNWLEELKAKVPVK